MEEQRGMQRVGGHPAGEAKHKSPHYFTENTIQIGASYLEIEADLISRCSNKCNYAKHLETNDLLPQSQTLLYTHRIYTL